MQSNSSILPIRSYKSRKRFRNFKPPRFRQDNIKGSEAETWFFRTVRAQRVHFPNWLCNIVPATYEQDLYHETDAVAICHDGTKIPIQIKSSCAATRGSCPRNGIVFVCQKGNNQTELMLDLLIRLWYYRSYGHSFEYDIYL